MFKHSAFCILLGITCSSLASIAPAQTFGVLARLDGAQETPPTPSTATGLGLVAIDVGTNTMTYREMYIGLGSPELAAHIHGFSIPGVPAPVIIGQALGALKCGTWAMTPTDTTNALNGLTYFNVHSTIIFSGGEIRGQIAERPDQTTLCYGDGSGTACPCANFSAIGDNEGCLHSGGTGARLQGYSGSTTTNPSISNDRLVLHLLRAPAVTPCVIFQGTATVSGGAGVVFGEGLLCVGGSTVRLITRFTCIGQLGCPEPGDPSVTILGGVGAPGTRYYQAWFRTGPPICALAQQFSLSNAVQVSWVP